MHVPFIIHPLMPPHPANRLSTESGRTPLINPHKGESTNLVKSEALFKRTSNGNKHALDRQLGTNGQAKPPTLLRVLTHASSFDGCDIATTTKS